MSSDQGIVVKAYLDCQEIRRFLIESGVVTNFEYLKQKTHHIFNIPQDEVLNFSWKDADKELIMMSSDEELVEALNHQKDGVFRVCVTRPSSSGVFDVHKNVICDACQGEVRGTRYKCTICPDYDLCSKCEFAGKHLDHNMMCVRRPSNPYDWNYWRDLAIQINSQAPSVTPPPPPPPHGRYGYYQPPWGAGYPWQCRKMWKKAFKCHQRLQRENSMIKESGACGSTAPSPMGNEAPEKLEGGEQPKWALTHKEFLKTMGEAVQSMLDPFGIDVSFSMEDSACNATQAANTAETGQDSCPKKKPETEEVVDVDKVEKKKSPQGMSVDLDSPVSSPDAQRTAEFIVIDDPDVEEVKKPCPKIMNSLELMKRMGFKDQDGWLTKLLMENDGNIDNVLDVLQRKYKS